MRQNQIILLKMEYLNRDILFEISKYILSYDLKSLIMAFDLNYAKEIYLRKRKKELEVIQKFHSNISCLTIEMGIFAILKSELRHYLEIGFINERFPQNSEIKYSAEIELSIHPELIVDFCRKLLESKKPIFKISSEFRIQIERSSLHIWIKNIKEINKRILAYHQ